MPELASQIGLKVLLGIWISNNRLKNAHLVDTAVALSQRYPDTVTTIIVGNEVLLHGDMTPSDLRELLLSVKARVTVPVTYAEVWEYWLRYREIQDAVDFVTIHVLPYWDNIPSRAEDAAAHVAAVHKQVSLAFPGKEVVIGETGWPSMGRMREGALPSRINQARVISEILDIAKRDHFRVNLIEAFDASWKRYWEGTVGGNWGLVQSRSSNPEIPARHCHQQLSAVEAADGKRNDIGDLRFRSGLARPTAQTVEAPARRRGSLSAFRRRSPESCSESRSTR